MQWKICKQYAQYARNMHNMQNKNKDPICQIFKKKMQNICKIFAKIRQKYAKPVLLCWVYIWHIYAKYALGILLMDPQKGYFTVVTSC